MRFVLILFLGVLLSCGGSSSAPDASQPDAAPLLEFGESCDSGHQCLTGTCRNDFQIDTVIHDLPDGLCTYSCGFNEDPCSAHGGVCISEGGDRGICYPSCKEGCREGWVCAWLFVEFCVPESFLGLAVPDHSPFEVTGLQSLRDEFRVNEIRWGFSVELAEQVPEAVGLLGVEGCEKAECEVGLFLAVHVSSIGSRYSHVNKKTAIPKYNRTRRFRGDRNQERGVRRYLSSAREANRQAQHLRKDSSRLCGSPSDIRSYTSGFFSEYPASGGLGSRNHAHFRGVVPTLTQETDQVFDLFPGTEEVRRDCFDFGNELLFSCAHGYEYSHSV